MIKLFACSLMILGLSISVTTDSATATTAVRIVALGDSLTEGYGVAASEAYPVLLQDRLRETTGNKDITVVNAGISGSTSASAAGRLKWLLKTPTDLVILALGANDGLRGIKALETKKNLASAIELAKREKVLLVLAGMKVPPNYGKEYANEFEKTFADLAKQFQIPLIPFLLEGVGGEPTLNQADGIHPNAKGQKIVAKTVYDVVLPLVKKIQKP